MGRKYQDIIYSRRPSSRRLDVDTAKIFKPFDALRGFNLGILTEEKNRLLVPRVIPSEQMSEELDYTLRQLRAGDFVRAVYFVPVKVDAGIQKGEYRSVSGRVEELDIENRLLRLSGAAIPIDDIKEVENLA